jgi:hypothetical protein
VIAVEQHGIVAREQLLAAGVSTSAVRRALRSGTLHRVHRAVYAAVDLKLLSEEGQLLAAVLAAGEGATSAMGRRPGTGASLPPFPR